MVPQKRTRDVEGPLITSNTNKPHSLLKDASDFMYRANQFSWLHGSKDEAMHHSIWARLRQSRFILPTSICAHDHRYDHDARRTGREPTDTSAWEVYDMNMAGLD